MFRTKLEEQLNPTIGTACSTQTFTLIPGHFSISRIVQRDNGFQTNLRL